MEDMMIIQLEDYREPRFTSKLRPYIGSLEDMKVFAERLAEDPNASVRYHETIEAIDSYEINPDGSHTMAGQEIPILTPAQTLDWDEFQLGYEDQWLYEPVGNPGYAPYYMICKDAELEMTLVRVGDELWLCARGTVYGMHRKLFGRDIYDETGVCGFPGICKQEPGLVEQLLYTVVSTYSVDEMDTAIHDLDTCNYIDLGIVFADVHPRAFAL